MINDELVHSTEKEVQFGFNKVLHIVKKISYDIALHKFTLFKHFLPV